MVCEFLVDSALFLSPIVIPVVVVLLIGVLNDELDKV